MKILKMILFGAFISFIANHDLLAVKWISRSDLVTDEEADLLQDHVPVSSFAKQTSFLSPQEKNEVEGLNFHTSLLRASGTQYLADHVLPLFPNLKALILSYNGLDDPSHRDVIVKILREFPNIDYVMINGNGIADHPEELAALVRDDPVLLQRLESKVVLSPEIIVDTIFSSPGLKEETVWRDTQHRFHRWWESQNSVLVGY